MSNAPLIKITLDAVEPETLFVRRKDTGDDELEVVPTPDGIYLRIEPRSTWAANGWPSISIIGNPEDVRAYVADRWGENPEALEPYFEHIWGPTAGDAFQAGFEEAHGVVSNLLDELGAKMDALTRRVEIYRLSHEMNISLEAAEDYLNQVRTEDHHAAIARKEKPAGEAVL